MSVPGTALFLLCGLIAVVSAFGTITVKSPIRAAMSLLVHIIALSGLFLTLHAHLLAALQLLVYAGAVVVLFVFVIMLIGPAVMEHTISRGLTTKAVGGALMAVVALAVIGNVAGASVDKPPIEACAPGQGAECQQFGGVGGFAHSLFLDGVVPFELIGILLTVAIVGAIAVAQGKSAKELAEAERRRRERAAAEAAQRERERELSAEVAAHGGH